MPYLLAPTDKPDQSSTIEERAEVASTIIEQIRQGDPLVMAYFKDLVVALEQNEKQKGGAGLTLRRKVGTHWFKVFIVLTWMDVYDMTLMEFADAADQEPTTCESLEGVYCDQLSEILSDWFAKIKG